MALADGAADRGSAGRAARQSPTALWSASFCCGRKSHVALIYHEFRQKPAFYHLETVGRAAYLRKIPGKL